MATSPIDVMLVTVPQAAQALQISDRTLFHLLKSQEIKSVQIAGTRRIDINELKRVVTEGTPERPRPTRGRPRKITTA
jgi:excisionase family DNA binding protein